MVESQKPNFYAWKRPGFINRVKPWLSQWFYCLKENDFVWKRESLQCQVYHSALTVYALEGVWDFTCKISPPLPPWIVGLKPRPLKKVAATLFSPLPPASRPFPLHSQQRGHYVTSRSSWHSLEARIGVAQIQFALSIWSNGHNNVLFYSHGKDAISTIINVFTWKRFASFVLMLMDYFLVCGKGLGFQNLALSNSTPST